MTTAHIEESLTKTGGFTVWPWDFAPYHGKGYAVGGQGYLSRIPIECINPDVLESLLLAYRALNSDSLFIGGWLEDGLVHIEQVRIYTSQRKAMDIAKLKGERFIYDFEKGVSIRVD